ncbi:hypothetical protein R6Z07F_019382 [Ovis aries]
MQPDPQETRRLSPEPVTGNRGRLGAAAAPRRQRDARSPRLTRKRFRAPFGEEDGRPVVPLRGEDARSPRTCSPTLRRQQAPPGSHGAVTPGPWSSAPGSAAEPQPSRESPAFPGKGPARGGRWVAPDERRTRPRAHPDRRAALTPRLSRASAWEPAPGPAGRGDPDNRREGGSWGDLPGQLREKARSSAIPERRTQAAQGQVPAPGRTWEFSEA